MTTNYSSKNIFRISLAALVLLSNYTLTLLDQSISVVSRGIDGMPSIALINMVAGPSFMIAFASVFVLILGQLGGSKADSALFVAAYRSRAKLMLVLGVYSASPPSYSSRGM